ncbi:hypothetical protein Pint_36005 [Pistacia integerrima]|uniref:Uncharacterized protein n=1 Tax=Pistacia integerrima TaxID=434235 RepID=A0ACC0Y443_9ROSI|nr:hypothetical protein Pint_36005 [Pistacia integerrima]
MDYTSKRSQGGLFEGLYRVIMRRNSIYVTFIIAGAFAGERAVDYGVRKLWEYNNVGLKTDYQCRFTVNAFHFFDLVFTVEVSTSVFEALNVFLVNNHLTKRERERERYTRNW